MACNGIGRDIVFAAEFKEGAYPHIVLDTAHSGAAYLETAVISLYCGEGLPEQPEILLHIRILPETGEIGLVPYFDGPVKDFFAVAGAEVFKQSYHHIRPFFVVPGRCGVALPVEYGLLAAGHL